MTPEVGVHLEEIRKLCVRFGVRTLFLVGSALDDRFDPRRSDVDFVVTFQRSERLGFDDPLYGLREGLRDLLGREIDLIEADVVRNHYLIASLNRSKRVLYAA